MKPQLPMLRNFQRRGVTLIELLIVAGIIGLLAAVGGVTFVGSQQKQVLRGAADQVLTDLKGAQNKALAGVQVSTAAGKTLAYRVRQIDAQTYAIEAGRDTVGPPYEGPINIWEEVSRRAVGASVSLNFPASPQFAISTGKVSAEVEVTASLGGNSVCIKVFASGSIVKGELDGPCPS